MKNKKKILAAAGILVLAGVAAVCYIQNRDKKEAASIGIIGGADGPTKIFLAGKIGSPDEETKAAVLDLETAKKQSYGDVVELDYVSKDKISLHGIPSDTFHLISIVPMTLRRWSRLQPTRWRKRDRS